MQQGEVILSLKTQQLKYYFCQPPVLLNVHDEDSQPALELFGILYYYPYSSHLFFVLFWFFVCFVFAMVFLSILYFLLSNCLFREYLSIDQFLYISYTSVFFVLLYYWVLMFMLEFHFTHFIDVSDVSSLGKYVLLYIVYCMYMHTCMYFVILYFCNYFDTNGLVRLYI